MTFLCHQNTSTLESSEWTWSDFGIFFIPNLKTFWSALKLSLKLIHLSFLAFENSTRKIRIADNVVSLMHVNSTTNVFSSTSRKLSTGRHKAVSFGGDIQILFWVALSRQHWASCHCFFLQEKSVMREKLPRKNKLPTCCSEQQ